VFEALRKISGGRATMATTPSSPVSRLPLGLRQALERGSCVLFLGAGIGGHYVRPDGTSAPDGAKLAEDLIAHFKLGIAPTDLPRVSQYAELKSSRASLDAFVRKALDKLEPDEHIQWLTTFRWRSIFTTNYDVGLERAYRLNPKPPQNPVPVAVTADLRYTDTLVDVPVFHLHGSPYNPCNSPIVITQTDYTRYQDKREMVWNRLKNEAATSTLLYIGYSGRDPNWQMIIDEVAREFSPSQPPVAYRIDPYADALDTEILRDVRRVETVVMSLPEFHALVEAELGDRRPDPDTINVLRNKIPQHLREAYDAEPAAMLRLLESWTYVNDESVTEVPNTKEFLRGSKPTWSLIAQNHRFVREVEEELWDWTLEFSTNPKSKSTAVALTGPAGYGITTIMMAQALRIVDARIGPVFMLREGAEVSEGDVAFAASLFPDVGCYFVIDQAREHSADIQAALSQQRNTKTNCLFIMGVRRNEWMSPKIRFKAKEFEIDPLSDNEINRLLDFLTAESSLGEMEVLDRDFQFTIVKNKHEKQLLVAMREAMAGEGVGFDSIIEGEYRSIDEENSPSVSRDLYLLVCCFYQHGMLIRDELLEDVLGYPLQSLYEDVGTNLEGLVEYAETNIVRGQFAARARHRIIAQIVWKKCGTRQLKEQLLQKAMEKLNLSYRLDRKVFELFFRTDEIVDTFSTMDGKIKFFETAARRDPNNVFVLQHFARMLLREKNYTLALNQIDGAISKDRTKTIRSLHHTRGLVLADLAMAEENSEMARKRLAHAEREFQFCMSARETDSYGHSGLARLYLNWSRRPKISDDEATEYLEKAEAVVFEGLKVVSERASLLITSADVQNDLGNQPARLSKLRQAVESDSASPVARYLLGRAYRDQGIPLKTIQVLDPIIKSDFKHVRAYIEYARAMLETGEPIKKACATLSVCRLDGETDSAFIGLYAGLLYLDGKYVEAQKLWDDARELDFSDEERIRRQFIPRDHGTGNKLRFFGVIVHTKPSFVIVQPDDGPSIISNVTAVGGKTLEKGQKVDFELSFSAKAPLAEHLRLA
jgi:tetratricopeptide (TPR) repeat protein/cold shock CspA family protein